MHSRAIRADAHRSKRVFPCIAHPSYQSSRPRPAHDGTGRGRALAQQPARALRGDVVFMFQPVLKLSGLD